MASRVDSTKAGDEIAAYLTAKRTKIVQDLGPDLGNKLADEAAMNIFKAMSSLDYNPREARIVVDRAYAKAYASAEGAIMEREEWEKTKAERAEASASRRARIEGIGRDYSQLTQTTDLRKIGESLRGIAGMFKLPAVAARTAPSGPELKKDLHLPEKGDGVTLDEAMRMYCRVTADRGESSAMCRARGFGKPERHPEPPPAPPATKKVAEVYADPREALI